MPAAWVLLQEQTSSWYIAEVYVKYSISLFGSLILTAVLQQGPKPVKMLGKKNSDSKGGSKGSAQETSRRSVSGPAPSQIGISSPKKPRKEEKKRSSKVHVDMHVQKYCKEASCVIEDWSEDVLFQVQLVSNGERPDLLWRISEDEGFFAFLAREKEQLRQALDADPENAILRERFDDFPGTAQEAMQAGFLLRKGGTYDPSSAKLKDWRKVGYHGGGAGLVFGISLFAGYFENKAQTDMAGLEVSVTILNATSVDLSCIEAKTGIVSFDVVTDVQDQMVHLLDAIPPLGWKVIEMLVQSSGNDSVMLSWCGPTYLFRQLVSSAPELNANWYTSEGDVAERGSGTYYITWNPVTRTDFDRLKVILSDEVFLGAPMVVNTQPNVLPSSCVEACLAMLADLPQFRKNAN